MEKAIRYFRKKHKLSQEKIAELINVSQQAYSKYERGYPIPYDVREKLAEIFNVDTGRLALPVFPEAFYKNLNQETILNLSVEELTFIAEQMLEHDKKNLLFNENLVPIKLPESIKWEIYKKRISEFSKSEILDLFLGMEAKMEKMRGEFSMLENVKQIGGLYVLKENQKYGISTSNEELWHDIYLAEVLGIDYELMLSVILKHSGKIISNAIKYAEDDILDSTDHYFKNEKDAENAANEIIDILENKKSLNNFNLFRLEMSSVGNPDKYEDPSNPVSPREYKIVSTLEEASLMCRKYIEKYDLGGGNWVGGFVSSEGKQVAYISYNGRIWKDMNDNFMRKYPNNRY